MIMRRIISDNNMIEVTYSEIVSGLDNNNLAIIMGLCS